MPPTNFMQRVIDPSGIAPVTDPSVVGGAEDASPTTLVLQYLKQRGYTPSSENVRRALEANQRDPGVIPGLRSDRPATEAEDQTAMRAAGVGSTGVGGGGDRLPGLVREEGTWDTGDGKTTSAPPAGSVIGAAAGKAIPVAGNAMPTPPIPPVVPPDVGSQQPPVLNMPPPPPAPVVRPPPAPGYDFSNLGADILNMVGVKRNRGGAPPVSAPGATAGNAAGAGIVPPPPPTLSTDPTGLSISRAIGAPTPPPPVAIQPPPPAPPQRPVADQIRRGWGLGRVVQGALQPLR